jgi:hypothetical protein
MFCDVRLPDVVHVARPNSNENRLRRERTKGIELGELRKCFQRKVICNGIIPAFAGAVIAASQYICVGGGAGWASRAVAEAANISFVILR